MDSAEPGAIASGRQPASFQALVLVPTQELCEQVGRQGGGTRVSLSLFIILMFVLQSRFCHAGRARGYLTGRWI